MKFIRSWRLWAVLHFVYHRPHGDRLPRRPTFHVANVPCEDSFKLEHVVPPCIPACSKFTFSRFQLLFVQHTSKPTPRKCHEGCLVSQNLTLNTKYVVHQVDHFVSVAKSLVRKKRHISGVQFVVVLLLQCVSMPFPVRNPPHRQWHRFSGRFRERHNATNALATSAPVCAT